MPRRLKRAKIKVWLAETSNAEADKAGVSKAPTFEDTWDYVKNNPTVEPEVHPERKNYFYKVNEEKAVFKNEVLRVTKVNLHEKYGEQCSNSFFSPHFLELDLSLKGDKAMLTGPYGEQKLTIKEAGDDVVVGRRKGSLTINIQGGKDGLKDWMLNPDKNDVAIDYVKSCLKQISREKKLVPAEYDSHQEIAKLKARPDFEYGKDYSYLYSKEPLPMYEKSKTQGR